MTTASFDEMHNADTRRTPRGTPKSGRRCPPPPPPSRSSACVCVPACAIPPQKRDAIMKRKTKREFCQSLVQNERQLNKKTPRRAYSYYKSYSIVLMCNSLQQHARTCANREPSLSLLELDDRLLSMATVLLLFVFSLLFALLLSFVFRQSQRIFDDRRRQRCLSVVLPERVEYQRASRATACSVRSETLFVGLFT